MINFIGDSHTRNFGNLKNVNSYFLGRGYDINLSSNKLHILKERLNNIKIDYSDTTFLCFGEADCRYQLENDHRIFRKKEISEVSQAINFDYLDECIINYKKLVDGLDYDVKILSPYSAYIPSIKSLKYFILKLKETFKDNMVVDIFKYTIDSNDYPLQNLINEDYKYDPVHMNENLRFIFEDVSGYKFTYEKKEGDNITRFGTIDASFDNKKLFII